MVHLALNITSANQTYCSLARGPQKLQTPLV